MFIEIKVVLNFLLSFLYDKLPRRRVNLFGDEVEKQLKLKLLASNWSAEQEDHVTTSLHESRSMKIDKEKMLVEPLLIIAATDSAMDLKEILECLPNYLNIFIEPGLVVYTNEPGELTNSDNIESLLKTLYKLPQVKLSNLEFRKTEPELVRESSESPVSSSSSISSSSSNADNFAFFDKNFPKSTFKSNSFFTPAEFAKTKFGSTKSKESFFNNPKPRAKATQNSQNSEFAAYIKQKLQVQSTKKSYPENGCFNTCLENLGSQLNTNLLFSNSTKSTSYASGFSPMPSQNLYVDGTGNLDFLVSSTIQGIIDGYDEDKHEKF